MPQGYKKRAEGASRKEKQGSSTKNSRKGCISNKEWDMLMCRDRDWTFRKYKEAAAGSRYDPVGKDAMYNDPVVEPPPPERPPPRYVDDGICLACMDEGVRVLDVGKCGHTMCDACLRRYYTQKDLDIYPLHCCICEKRVHINALERDGVLGIEDVATVRRLGGLARERKRGKHWGVTCPRCRISSRTRENPLGRSHWCSKCFQHFRVNAKEEAVEATELGGVLGDQFGQCPHCGIGFERTMGCDSIRCTHCNHHFWFQNRRLGSTEDVDWKKEAEKEVFGEAPAAAAAAAGEQEEVWDAAMFAHLE